MHGREIGPHDRRAVCACLSCRHRRMTMVKLMSEMMPSVSGDGKMTRPCRPCRRSPAHLGEDRASRRGQVHDVRFALLGSFRWHDPRRTILGDFAPLRAPRFATARAGQATNCRQRLTLSDGTVDRSRATQNSGVRSHVIARRWGSRFVALHLLRAWPVGYERLRWTVYIHLSNSAASNTERMRCLALSRSPVPTRTSVAARQSNPLA